MSHGHYTAPFVRQWWPRGRSRCTSGHVVNLIRNLQKETQMPSNPNQTPAEPRKSRKILDEVQQAMREKLSDAADRIDLAAAEDPVLDPIGQNPVPMDIGTEANEKQADLTIGNDLSGGTTDAPPQECD